MDNPLAILYPSAALMLLYFLVLSQMGRLRYKNIRSGKIPASYFKLYQGPVDLPPNLIAATRNFSNLFEVPVLFFILSILFFVTGLSDKTTALLAWAFVITRYLHSIVHISSNNLILRMRVYLIGVLILIVYFAIWVFRLINL